MNIVTMEGEIWWFFRPDDVRPIKGLTIYALMKKIQETFNFASFPTSLPAEGQPFVFKEGYLIRGENTISIKFLESYLDGTHIKVDSSTDDVDIVFHRLREIAVELGGESNIRPTASYHVSTIVADFDNNINSALKSFSTITSLISENLEVQASVDVKAIYLEGDKHKQQQPLLARLNPTAFRLETRIDARPDENRYFCQAHMTSDAHIKVLSALDSMLSGN
jgi:hypothetical protein